MQPIRNALSHISHQVKSNAEQLMRSSLEMRAHGAAKAVFAVMAFSSIVVFSAAAVTISPLFAFGALVSAVALIVILPPASYRARWQPSNWGWTRPVFPVFVNRGPAGVPVRGGPVVVESHRTRIPVTTDRSSPSPVRGGVGVPAREGMGGGAAHVRPGQRR